MADEFPRAEVVGVDLAPIQPRYPSLVSFFLLSRITFQACASSCPCGPREGTDTTLFAIESSRLIARTYTFALS